MSATKKNQKQKQPTTKGKPKGKAAAEPFYKRYGHISDEEENSSAEGRTAAKRFEALAGKPISNEQQPPPTPVESDMKQFHHEIITNMTGYMQSIIFGIYFDREALDQDIDDEAFRLDKNLALAALSKAAAFEAFLEGHKQNLYRVLQRTKLKPKSPISLFHAELFKDGVSIHRDDVKTAPKGAVNVWSNEPFRADVACSRLTLVGGGQGSFSVYVLREQADFLCMCHTIYQFRRYAMSVSLATAPDCVTEVNLSFVNTWDRVVGGLVDEVHLWQWNGSTSPFVKLVVKLRETLQATCEWVGAK